MNSKDIYEEMKKYPIVFQIENDEVVFNLKYAEIHMLAQDIVDDIVSNKRQTLLLMDKEIFDKCDKNIMENDVKLKICLVGNKFSEGNSVDLVYGDILWANIRNCEYVKLVFNWEKYIDIYTTH